MQTFQVRPVGQVQFMEEGAVLQLEREFAPALRGLEGFSHVQVIWWFSELDQEELRRTLEVPKPYKGSPEVMGIFSTRSPVRPNPLALTAVQIIRVDEEQGVIYIPYIDAHPGTPILDIKPYTPSLDRVESPDVPDWCTHWPKSLEDSADFPWEKEFNF